MISMRWISSLVLLLLASACGDDPMMQPPPPPPPDSGVVDAGTPDTGLPDSGPLPPSIVSFSASATEVLIGTGLTLSYEVANAESVTLTKETNSGSSLVISGPAFMRTLEIDSLEQATNFRLKAHGENETVERTVSVAVSVPDVMIIDFSATPNPATPGSEVIVRWQTQGADRVRVYDRGVTLVNTSSRAAAGELRVIASEQGTKLILEASNPWRTRSSTIDLTSTGSAQVLHFDVSPAVFRAARTSATLTWHVRGETVEIFAGDTPIAGVPPNALTGNVAVEISEPTLFTLRVTGEGRTAIARRIANNNAVNEGEPNDETVGAQTLRGGVLGALDRFGDQDFYRLPLAMGGHLFIDLWSVSGICPRGVGLRVLDANGVELIERDARETTPCPSLDPIEDLAVRSLPPGEYFVVVDGPTATLEYGLATLVLEGRCGDGWLEPASEACDDGGTTSGDGCSATCQMEITGTLTFPGADVVRTDALGVNQVDYYEVIVTSSVALAFETGAPGQGECNADTMLALFDSGRSIIAGNDDALGLCAALPARVLEVGTYHLRVQAFNPAVEIASYALSVRVTLSSCGDNTVGPGETCDDGNLTDGDGCSASCVIERLPTPGSLVVDIPPGAARMVEVEVTTPGQSITATTSDGAGGCGADTRLILAGPSGYLGYDTNGGGCARFNPRIHQFAADLDPGVYRLILVNDGSLRSTITLDVSVNDPECGNGIRETRAMEMCDDGNLVEDDGCTAMCLRSLGGTAMGPGGPPAIFAGDIVVPGDHITYGILLSAPGNLFIDIGIPTIGQCLGDSVIELYDASQNFVTWNDDFGGSLCSRIDALVDPSARVPAGAYTLLVRSYSPMPMTFEVRIEMRGVGCGNAILEVGEQCDDGNQMPGDGCSELCQFEP